MKLKWFFVRADDYLFAIFTENGREINKENNTSKIRKKNIFIEAFFSIIKIKSVVRENIKQEFEKT